MILIMMLIVSLNVFCIISFPTMDQRAFVKVDDVINKDNKTTKNLHAQRSDEKNICKKVEIV